MDKSTLFTTYNKARTAARNGKLDPKSVNGALSVLQSSEPRPYHTTIHGCDCPARKFNPGKACKHMIAEMIKVRAEPKPAAPAVEINEITGLPYTPEPPTQPGDVFIHFGDGSVYTVELLPVGYNRHWFRTLDEGMEWVKNAQHYTIAHPRNARGRLQGKVEH